MTKFITTTALALMAAFFFLTAGIDGKWQASIDTDQGPLSFTIDYKVDGKKLSGTISSEYGDINFDGGTVQGNTFEYTFYMDAEEVTHKGKLLSGKLEIDWETVNYGEGSFTMTRVP